MEPLNSVEGNQELRQQAKKLCERSHVAPQTSNLLPLTLEELTVAVEELQVADEELRQQNEQLMLSQVQLEVERRRYRELFDFAPDGYLVTDFNGAILEANRAVAHLLNLSDLLLLGKLLISFVDLSERHHFRELITTLLNGAQELEWELTLRPRHRAPITVAAKVVAVRDSTNQPLCLRWSLRDITSRKQMEQQLQRLNQELMQRAAFDDLLHRICDRVRENLSESEILQTAVQSLTEALGLLAYDAGAYDLARGQSTVRFSHTAAIAPTGITRSGTVDMQAFAEGYRQLLTGQEFQFCEISAREDSRQVSILACPIVSNQEVMGDLWCFLPQNQAFTAHQIELARQVANQCAIGLGQARLYQAARIQAAELQRLSELKEDFLSTVSHELRTPLTNIKMALHLLKVAKTDEQRERCMHILQQECDREIELVTDLLDLQQLEADVYPSFFPEAIRLTDLLQTILAPLRRSMREQQQMFSLTLPETPLDLVSDRASLRRVLIELLRNAQKYTPSGGEIQLTIADQPDTESVAFTLKNQAQIPAADLPHIFEKFYRVPNGDAWSRSGTGLGLSLVKRLVESMHGTIAVESEDGWTTFIVRLPHSLAS